MADMGEVFREWKGVKRACKKARREDSIRRLSEEGLQWRSNNGAVHCIIKDRGAEWDFWPTTGRWRTRAPLVSGSHQGTGIEALIRCILQDRINSEAYHGDIDGDSAY